MRLRGIDKRVLFIAIVWSRTVLAAPNAADLSVGDWVLRAGVGQESALIRRISNSDYSHIGIVVETTPEVKIIHATTNDDAAHANQVILTDYASFSSPKHARWVAAIRPQFLTAKQKQQIADYATQQLGKPFRLVSREDSPLYCTTLIVDALHAAGITVALNWRQVNWGLIKGEYLFPQAFSEISNIRWLPGSEGKNGYALSPDL